MTMRIRPANREPWAEYCALCETVGASVRPTVVIVAGGMADTDVGVCDACAITVAQDNAVDAIVADRDADPAEVGEVDAIIRRIVA